jgi:hypothetical protein
MMNPTTHGEANLQAASVQDYVRGLRAFFYRHTFATNYLLNGGDVFTLQQILGHTTLEMVRSYVNLASAHVRVQHRKFSPMDRMKLGALNFGTAKQRANSSGTQSTGAKR